jgi:hypothetical protein
VCNFYTKSSSPVDLDDMVNNVLSAWTRFEEYAISLPTNSSYFRIYVDPDLEEKQKELNFSGYYKGKTLDSDLAKFFVVMPLKNDLSK